MCAKWRLRWGLVQVGTQPRTASGGRARAGPGPNTRLRAAWVVFRGTAPVLAGASAVCARAQWPPDCAWTWQGLGPRRGSGAWRPEDPLYAVQGAPSAISCLEPRAVRAGAQGRRSGGAGPLIHTAGDRRGEFRPRRSTARERWASPSAPSRPGGPVERPRRGAGGPRRETTRRRPLGFAKAGVGNCERPRRPPAPLLVGCAGLQCAAGAWAAVRPPRGGVVQGAVLCGAPAHRRAPPAYLVDVYLVVVYAALTAGCLASSYSQ